MNKTVNFFARIVLSFALVSNTCGYRNLAFAANYNTPGGQPDYLGGVYPNYANSPVIRKFVDSLPGLGSANKNNLNQYIPIAVKDTSTYGGDDYYQIGVTDYTQQLHSDLPPTKLRGYRDLQATGTDAQNHYLGPFIIARKGTPTRIKFVNMLGTGKNGNLFIPVDKTMMGAGMGPLGMTPPVGDMDYTENRAVVHLHGGDTPWISDGTPHQWITPAGEVTSYSKGVSFENVPDMVGPGKTIPTPSDSDGLATYYYPNGQPARLMFYHDHAYGITRLNVYAGEAGAYLLTDQAEDNLITALAIPGQDMVTAGKPEYKYGIPLIIQDKTFVDAPNIASQDPTWDWGTTAPTPNTGDLWYPHVYMPNQNPADPSGANAMGRWDYGPWFWPVFSMIAHGPVPDPVTGAMVPDMPIPSSTMEAFMDTPLINGCAYPYINVGKKAYRFRILNVCNDRSVNLQLYFADTGGGGTGASATATVTGGVITAINVVNGGSGYPAAPYVNIADASGDGALATATISGGIVTGVTVNSGGSGYSSSPTVAFSSGGPGGSGAAAVSTIANGMVTQVAIANGGTAYTSAPGVYIVGGGGEGAAATATVSGGVVTAINVTSGGTGYTSAPTVVIGGDTEVKMVPAVPNAGLPANWPTDGRDGGVPDPTTAGPKLVQIGTEGGFLPAPVVFEQTPIGYEYNRKSIVVLNVNKTALYLMPAERADVIIDFSQVPDGTKIILYNDAPAAMPAFDPRYDYYTGAPDQSYATGNGTGGAPTPLPGYGPNTRTIMQFRVSASLGTSPAFNLTTLQTQLSTAYASQPAHIVPDTVYSKIQDTSLTFATSTIGSITVTNGGTGYTTATVAITGGGGTGATATATVAGGAVTQIAITNQGTGYTSNPTVNITGDGTGATATAARGLAMKPKAIQELFELDYGRMNATLGVELPFTNSQNQTTIPYGYIDPPTEMVKPGEPQVWKITHNGVDSHAIHFHLYNVQVINRVGWDGAIRPPHPNELGWKETVRMDPLEDCIVALKPITPVTPFNVPDSIRALDPTMPLGSTAGFFGVDPNGNPVNQTNELVNFGWEYVWHCHLLDHEEMDMMRPVIFEAPAIPGKPGNIVATGGNASATVSFEYPLNPSSTAITGFTVTATPGGQTANGISSPIAINGLTNGTSYTFTVRATNALGTGENSVASNAVIPGGVPGAPTGVSAISGNGQAYVLFTAPSANGSPITQYTVTSNPGNRTATGTGSPVTITGLTTRASYTFTVTATNAFGTGPASAASASIVISPGSLPPGPPTNVVATAGNAQATVTFNAPSANGSAITGYTVTSHPAGGVDANANSTALTHTVTGLINGTAYYFTVVAVNSRGSSPASAPSNTVTPSAPTSVPGAPTAVTAAPGNTTASVSFTAPASTGGSPITSYTVTSNPSGLTGTGAASPITVSGLTNGTSYTFTVTATNAIGTGPASAASAAVTPVSAPGVVTGVTAVAGNGQATVSFTAPSANGSPITSYKVTSNPGNFTATGVASPIAVTGLTNGTQYRFTVTATNAIGTSPISAPSNSVMPAAPPGAPTIGVATAGSASASVSFTPPAASGVPITLYTATSNPGNITGTATASPISVTGLTNGQSYTFTVTATSSMGISPASAASNSVVPSGLAGAPTAVSAVGGSGQATVTFTAPASNGGSTIVAYLVTSNPGGLTAIGAASPITITGLTNGNTYTFTVAAVNLVGTGPASAASNSVTLASTAPGAPTGATAVAGNAQATVSFTAPVSGGSSILFYRVTSNPGGLTNTGPLSPLTVTGLTNGQSYTFTVTATNAIGTGPASAASNAVTPTLLTVPGVPTGASAVGANAQATVTFTAPASNGGSPILYYTATSNPGSLSLTGPASPLVVTGLTNGTSYTFTVTATNAQGTSAPSTPTAAVIPATLPGAPTIGTATASAAQASVAFTAPASNGGSAITVYTATSNPGNLTGTGPSSPLTVTGLTNGQLYTFTVTATNGVGTGPASGASNAVTPIAVPGAPTGVSAAPGNAQATVSFTAPSANGSPITTYTATSNPGSLTATGPSSPLIVTGLTNGLSYTFTVTATNAVGTGPASAPSVGVTPASVPGAPTIGTATAGDTQASVTFTAPASNGGSAITSYIITSSPSSITATGPSSPLIITGLTNGTSYTFTVAATNLIGTGTASAASNAVTPVGLPGAPTGVSAVPANTQATVSFTAPSANGSPITLYTATSNPGGLTGTGPSSPLVVTGLTNGLTYTFTVRATNGVGQGAASAASVGVIPATVPGAPIGASAVGGNAQATVTFTAPVSNGGSAITSYMATSNPGGLTGTGPASPLVVTGLTNGTSYTFTVTATNPVGTGAASGATNAVTPATIPGAPVIGVATGGDTQATVAFTAPASNGGSAISLYTATSNPGGFTGTGPSSPLVVTGLTNGNNYTFSVTATNGIGTGAASAASNSVTPNAPPAAPTNFTAASLLISRTAVQVTLNWSESSVLLSGFTVQRATDSSFTQNVITTVLGAAARSYVDSSAGRLTTYYYRVQANNSGVNSAWTTLTITTP